MFWTILETEKGIFEAILGGKVDLESAPWPSISAAAKDLIRKMLDYDPKKRITASDALGMFVIELSPTYILIVDIFSSIACDPNSKNN